MFKPEELRHINQGVSKFFILEGSFEPYSEVICKLWACAGTKQLPIFYKDWMLSCTPIKREGLEGKYLIKYRKGLRSTLKKLYPESVWFGSSSDRGDSYGFLRPDVLVHIGTDMRLSLVTHSNSTIIQELESKKDDLLEYRKVAPPSPPVPEINIVYPIDGSLELYNRRLGDAYTVDDILCLYGQEGLDKYNNALDILNEDPSHGIILLDGPPGTGKTNLIKAITRDVDSSCIFVPPNVSANLADSNYTSFFIRQSGKVMIIEDAENIVQVKAGQCRDKATQALLNMADGLLAEVLGSPFIITVNCKKAELDPALIRAGRLRMHWEVGPVAEENATAYSARLHDKHPTKYNAVKFTESTTVAEIYAQSLIVK